MGSAFTSDQQAAAVSAAISSALTLDQVEQVGRFAYSVDIEWSEYHDCVLKVFMGDIYVEGRFFWASDEWGTLKETDATRDPESLWSHLPGCDCKFCGRLVAASEEATE